jgi:hypothetical protein
MKYGRLQHAEKLSTETSCTPTCSLYSEASFPVGRQCLFSLVFWLVSRGYLVVLSTINPSLERKIARHSSDECVVDISTTVF